MTIAQDINRFEKYINRRLYKIYSDAYDDIADNIRKAFRQGKIPHSRLIQLRNTIKQRFSELNGKTISMLDRDLENNIFLIVKNEKVSLENQIFNKIGLKLNLTSPALTKKFIGNLLKQGIEGIPFSSRIWKNGTAIRDKLLRTLSTYTTQGLTAGQIASNIRPFLLDPKGYGNINGLVKRYKTLARKIKDIDPEKYKLFMQKAKEIDATIPRMSRGVYRSAYKNAWRVSVSEFNVALQKTQLAYYDSKPFIKKAKWNLNPIGHHCEVCLGYSGKTYIVGNYPIKPHAVCRCFPTAVIDYNYLKKKYGITKAG